MSSVILQSLRRPPNSSLRWVLTYSKSTTGSLHHFPRCMLGRSGFLVSRTASCPWSNFVVQSAGYRTESGVYGYVPSHYRTPTIVEVPKEIKALRIEHANVHRLITAFREHGHKIAAVDPLELAPLSSGSVPELDPREYGLSPDDPLPGQSARLLPTFCGPPTVEGLVDHLTKLYCGPISVEVAALATSAEKEWLVSRYEELHGKEMNTGDKVDLAQLLLKSQAVDHFLAVKFPTLKRYGGEGAEAATAAVRHMLKQCATETSIQDVVICIPHRGRTNLLLCVLDFPPELIMKKAKGGVEFPENVRGSGDVLSHLSTSVDLTFGDKKVHTSLIPNPSHLEVAVPVAVGKTRARLQTRDDITYRPLVEGKPEGAVGDNALCLQIHGDAAVSAQGVVAETFALSSTPHFDVGGCLHLIVNNQVGFTTPMDYGRSFPYPSCVSKMNSVPVIHVNGDRPEAVVMAMQLALEYRQAFRKDAIVDLVCYRKWGHNEVDDPTFTQPHMYKAVRSHRAAPDSYASQLVEAGLCEQSQLDQCLTSWNEELSQSLLSASTYQPKANHLEGLWKGYVQAPPTVASWDTGVDADLLKYIGAQSVTYPDSMTVHPTLVKTHCERRKQRLVEGSSLDWATAEALAMGSLMYQGTSVRISGQDVGRGTFSHRHAMLVDQQTDCIHIPLNDLESGQGEGHVGKLEIANSLLSEEAVLAFEYGFSIESPRTLAIWEAQFGDFFNGAQIVIDTYVTSGEAKWLLQSGLVLLLPTGMDGAGPEHSSCRLERFLQLTDSAEQGRADGDDCNMRVVYPTTPAQYFHLLRRQVVTNYRKPLIVAAPKTLLRLPEATSSLVAMVLGTSFQPVLADDTLAASPSSVAKVILCSGKHYYTLAAHAKSVGVKDVAIVRLEELCPFPTAAVSSIIASYKNVKEFVWAQEEPRNSGAWTFVRPRLENILGAQLRYAGRDTLACPATGLAPVYQAEAKQILTDALG